MVVEIRSAVALRMMFATDLLTPALRWSQTAKTQTIFTSAVPGTNISVLIIVWISYLPKTVAYLFEHWNLEEYSALISRMLDAPAHAM
jgi:hypothetical protein